MSSHRRLAARRERGAVLIVSLVMLVVLTLLGVSVMNMTQLQERMASNTQEVFQAFQSAETGLSAGFRDEDVWNPTPGVTVNGTTGTAAALENVGLNGTNSTTIPSGLGRADSVVYVASYVASSNPPTGYDVAKFQRAHFDFRSSGTSQSGFTSILHGGGSQVFRRTGVVE